MGVFVRSVEEGSFSAAARSLDMSPSAVSKQIHRLEERLGVRLLHRSTRSLTLADEGAAYYECCARIAADIADAESLAGLGIARLSAYLVARHLKSGRLAGLLPAWSHDTSDVPAVYPNRRNLPPRVRLFIDFLAEQPGDVPPWERGERAACRDRHAYSLEPTFSPSSTASSAVRGLRASPMACSSPGQSSSVSASERSAS